MLDIKLFEQSLDKMLDTAVKHQDNATSSMQVFFDTYELPSESNQRNLIHGGQEFILVLHIPAGEIPEGAKLIHRVDMEERIRSVREGLNLIGQEEE